MWIRFGGFTGGVTACPVTAALGCLRGGRIEPFLEVLLSRLIQIAARRGHWPLVKGVK